MNIAPNTLAAQFYRARHDWPFIDDAERRHGLPRLLLYAVGSRETNLTDEVGDGGHGRGAFQLDDRSHTIPDPFPVSLQADIAAQMLAGLIALFQRDVMAALCAYNAGAGAVLKVQRAGIDPNRVTAGHDYGRDVLDRLAYLLTIDTPNPVEDDVAVFCTPDPNGGFWRCDSDTGAVFAFEGARYLGGLPSHPDWNAGAGKANGPVFAFGPSGDGYAIITRDTAGTFHPYHFPGDGSLK